MLCLEGEEVHRSADECMHAGVVLRHGIAGKDDSAVAVPGAALRSKAVDVPPSAAIF